GVPGGQFLLYGRLVHTLKTHWDTVNAEPATHEVLHSLLTLGEESHLITKIYRAQVEAALDPLRSLRGRWEGTIGRELTDSEWKRILAYPRKISRNTRLRYIQYNYLHRTYLTPHRLFRIYGGTLGTCPRCGGGGADFDHMVWTCPAIQIGWREILPTLTELFEFELRPTPELCLLGLRPAALCGKVKGRFLDLSLALYKRLISRGWKTTDRPLLSDWKRDISTWSSAELQVLKAEEARNIRQVLIAPGWENLMTSWESINK
ncbi:hypothetical protein NDU88_006469, partial [Pleurodeles waltl]